MEKSVKPVINNSIKQEFANTMGSIIEEADKVNCCSHIIKDPNVDSFAAGITEVKGKEKTACIDFNGVKFEYPVKTFKCSACGKEIEFVAAAANALGYIRFMESVYEFMKRVVAGEKLFLATMPDIKDLGEVILNGNTGVNVDPLNIGDRLAGLMTGIIPISSQSNLSHDKFNIDSDIMRASDIMTKEVYSQRVFLYKQLEQILTNKGIINANNIKTSEHVPTIIKDSEQIIQLSEKYGQQNQSINKLTSTVGRRI